MLKLRKNKQLIERNYWLIRLRWLAVAGVFAIVFFVKKFAFISLYSPPIYIIAAFIGIYNFVLLITLNSTVKKNPRKVLNRAKKLASLQIYLDLFSLILLVHFSGGIENPFIFYFVFHTVIASILLERHQAFIQTTITVMLFIIMVVLEYLGIIKHYGLNSFIPFDLYNNIIYVAGVSFVFISTLYITIYMTSAIVERLKQHEKQVEEANVLLKEQDKMKSEYVLRVTHDIKGDLAAIQSCIEPVTKGITGKLDPKQLNLLQRAERRTGRLLFFVKALLEITTIKLKKEIEMEHFSFKEMLSDIASNVNSRIKSKEISFNIVISPGVGSIIGSKIYIRETIENLLFNAIKYTPRCGTIELVVKDKGDSLLLHIKDTGIGIPEHDIKRVFEEFYRASNAKKTEHSGTGLGLSIAKKVIERHKGKIWVESIEGKGSTFYILLPK